MSRGAVLPTQAKKRLGVVGRGACYYGAWIPYPQVRRMLSRLFRVTQVRVVWDGPLGWNRSACVFRCLSVLRLVSANASACRRSDLVGETGIMLDGVSPNLCIAVGSTAKQWPPLAIVFRSSCF